MRICEKGGFIVGENPVDNGKIIQNLLYKDKIDVYFGGE